MNHRFAFSLIELLVGLIIISCALATFAPVMERRVRAQSAVLDSKLTEKCLKPAWRGNCRLCQGAKYCVQCDLGCNVDQKLDVGNCRCVDY